MLKLRKKDSWIYIIILVAIIALIAWFVSLNIKKTRQPPSISENDFTIPLYQFRNGEKLSNLRIHYATLGTAERDGNGKITNAVLVLHGSNSNGNAMLTGPYQDNLYGPGKPLDATKYYLIFPDDIGHGKSSKPSDGLRMNFPTYDYQDMVNLEHRLITEKLGIMHLQMILGVSMGGMHAWMWSELYPNFMDGIMPIAALPHRIQGRNLLWHEMVIAAIRNDPRWKDGNYEQEPYGWVAVAPFIQLLMGSPEHFEKTIPDVGVAQRFIQDQIQAARTRDANDVIYSLQAATSYNPEPELNNIKTKVYLLTFADDSLTPLAPNMLPNLIKRVKDSRAVVQPGSDDSFGHMTSAHPELWAGQVGTFVAFVTAEHPH